MSSNFVQRLCLWACRRAGFRFWQPKARFSKRRENHARLFFQPQRHRHQPAGVGSACVPPLSTSAGCCLASMFVPPRPACCTTTPTAQNARAALAPAGQAPLPGAAPPGLTLTLLPGGLLRPEHCWQQEVRQALASTAAAAAAARADQNRPDSACLRGCLRPPCGVRCCCRRWRTAGGRLTSEASCQHASTPPTESCRSVGASTSRDVAVGVAADSSSC